MLEAHGTGESKEPLAQAALSDPERNVVSRLVGLLEDELAGDLRAIWLYGSRARGDASITETDPDLKSDIDLMVIADGGRQRYDERVHDLAHKTAVDGGESPVWYSVFVFDPEWLRARREIKSFFIQNVDRDKLVLAGSALE
jgi:predicted nucleotidyltransferase